jgi:hypothetical protein
MISKRGGVSGICNNRVSGARRGERRYNLRTWRHVILQAPLQRFASSQTFEYLSAMANEIAIVDGEDLRKRAGALRRFL